MPLLWPSREPPPGVPPITRDEVVGALERPPGLRAALPRPGEHVLYRAREWGETVPAVITAVQDMTVPADANGGDDGIDVHVWAHPDPAVPPSEWDRPRHRRRLALRADPWPRVTLAIDGGSQAVCRESRVRGAPGWLRDEGNN